MTIDSVAASCGSEKTFSSNVSPFVSYSTEGKEVGDVLGDALSNHTKIMNLYREAVLGDEPMSETAFEFAPEGLAENLKSAYGPKAMESCNTS